MRRAQRCALTVIAAVALSGTGAPTPAHAAFSADTIQLRSKVFGAANVDQATGAVRPGRVIFSWLGVSSYAAAIDGRVVLFDAYVHRGPRAGYVPLTIAQTADLRPERIYLGHGHSDHGGDLDGIARRSGAQVIGTEEHCAAMRARIAASNAPGPVPACLGVMAASAPTGTAAALAPLGDAQVVAVRHPHSAFAAPDRRARSRPFIPTLNLSTLLRAAAVETGSTGATAQLCRLLPGRTSAPKPAPSFGGEGRYPEGGALLYRFSVRGFSFAWYDSVAPLRESRRDLFGVLEDLGPVDVQLGSVQTVNMLSNGFRDTRTYVAALRPKIFVPSHHDFLGPGASARLPIQSELNRLPQHARPEMRFLTDPAGYLRPDALTFPIPGS